MSRPSLSSSTETTNYSGPPRIGSFFTGVGGMLRTCVAVGFTPVLFSENNEFWTKQLRKLYKNAHCIPDMATFTDDDVQELDFAELGIPCTGTSSRGKHEGLDNKETQLALAIIKYLEIHLRKFGRLPILLIENPPGALSCYLDPSTNKAKPAVFAVFYSNLITVGYKSIAHTTINAKDFGLPQSRERVIAFASASDLDVRKIIFGRFDNDPAPFIAYEEKQESIAFIVDIGEATHVQAIGSSPCLTASNSSRLLYISESVCGTPRTDALEILQGFSPQFSTEIGLGCKALGVTEREYDIQCRKGIARSCPQPIIEYYVGRLWKIMVLNNESAVVDISSADPIVDKAFAAFTLMNDTMPTTAEIVETELRPGSKSKFTTTKFTPTRDKTNLPKHFYFSTEDGYREMLNHDIPQGVVPNGVRLEDLAQHIEPLNIKSSASAKRWVVRMSSQGLMMGQQLHDLLAAHNLMPITCNPVLSFTAGVGFVEEKDGQMSVVLVDEINNLRAGRLLPSSVSESARSLRGIEDPHLVVKLPSTSLKFTVDGGSIVSKTEIIPITSKSLREALGAATVAGGDTELTFRAGVEEAAFLLHAYCHPKASKSFTEACNGAHQRVSALFSAQAKAAERCNKCKGCVDYNIREGNKRKFDAAIAPTECVVRSRAVNLHAGRYGAVVSMLESKLIGSRLTLKYNNLSSVEAEVIAFEKNSLTHAVRMFSAEGAIERNIILWQAKGYEVLDCSLRLSPPSSLLGRGRSAANNVRNAFMNAEWIDEWEQVKKEMDTVELEAIKTREAKVAEPNEPLSSIQPAGEKKRKSRADPIKSQFILDAVARVQLVLANSGEGSS